MPRRSPSAPSPAAARPAGGQPRFGFEQTPAVNVGFRTGAEAVGGTLEDRLREFSGLLTQRYELQSKIAAQREASQVGMEFRPREGTSASVLEYNRTGMSRHAAVVDRAVRTEYERLVAKHMESPSGPQDFQAAWQAYGQGLLEEITPELRSLIEAELGLRAQTGLNAIDRVWQQREDAENTAELRTSIIEAAKAAISATHAGDAELAAHEHRKMIGFFAAGEGLDGGRPLLDPAWRERFLPKYQQALAKERYWGQFERADDPAAFVSEFREKGVPKDLTPDDHRDLATSFQSRIRSALVEDRRQRTEREQALRARGTEAVKMLTGGYWMSDHDQVAELELELSEAGMTEELTELRATADGAEIAYSLARMPPTAAEDLAATIGRQVKTPAARIQYETAMLMYAKGQRAKADDPLRHGAQLLEADLPPLDLATAGGLADSVAARKPMVDAIAGMYGSPPSYLQASEASALVTMLETAPAATQLAYLGALEGALGDAAFPIYEQFDKNEAGLLALTGSMMHEGARGQAVARDVLAGRERILAKVEGAPQKIDYEPVVHERLAGVYDLPGQASHRRAVVEAALGYYMTRKVGKDLSWEPDLFSSALEAVTGGIYEWSGSSWYEFGVTSRVETPARGVTADQFETWLDGIGPADIKAMGGVQGLSDEQAVKDLKQWGRLVTMGRGEYAVMIGPDFWFAADDKVNQDLQGLFLLAWPEE